MKVKGIGILMASCGRCVDRDKVFCGDLGKNCCIWMETVCPFPIADQAALLRSEKLSEPEK